MSNKILQNFLPNAFQKAANSFSELEGIRFQTQDILKNELIHWRSAFGSLLGTTLICEDITGPLDHGWQMNAPVSIPFIVQKSNVQLSLRSIQKWRCRLIVLQASEIFDRLFIEFGRAIDQEDNSYLEKSALKKTLKRRDQFKAEFRQGKAINQEYFSFIQQHIPEFSDALKNNYKRVDYFEYLAALRFIRNLIAHGKTSFHSSDDKHLYNKKRVKNWDVILKYQFGVLKKNDIFFIRSNDGNCREIIRNLTTVCFQLFKQVGCHFKIYEEMLPYIHFKPPSNPQTPSQTASD